MGSQFIRDSFQLCGYGPNTFDPSIWSRLVAKTAALPLDINETRTSLFDLHHTIIGASNFGRIHPISPLFKSQSNQPIEGASNYAASGASSYSRRAPISRSGKMQVHVVELTGSEDSLFVCKPLSISAKYLAEKGAGVQCPLKLICLF